MLLFILNVVYWYFKVTYPKGLIKQHIRSLWLTRHYTVWLKTFRNVCKVMLYWNCALCLAPQMRQDQAQWRASMTLWTLTLCLRRLRGVYTADTPYWQLSDPRSWATSQPQPKLHLMFTYLNIEIGKKKNWTFLLRPGRCWGLSTKPEKWNNDRKKCVDVEH